MWIRDFVMLKILILSHEVSSSRWTKQGLRNSHNKTVKKFFFCRVKVRLCPHLLPVGVIKLNEEGEKGKKKDF